MPFHKNVFVNCPFDEEFYDLLRPLLFTVVYVDLTPRIALEVMDSGKVRIDRIVELIRESQYAIHDLSRIVAVAAGDLYRLNMPFELGIDLGADTLARANYGARGASSLRPSPIGTKQRSLTYRVRTSHITEMSRRESSLQSGIGSRIPARSMRPALP